MAKQVWTLSVPTTEATESANQVQKGVGQTKVTTQQLVMSYFNCDGAHSC